MSDAGGDAACWAHVFEEGITTFDDAAPAEGEVGGAVWSLPHGGGLDANVVRLAPGGAIGEHVNDQVDVLLVVWSGEGELVVDERRVPLCPGTIVLVPSGTNRRVSAGTTGLTYLSTHPRRGPITIGPRRE